MSEKRSVRAYLTLSYALFVFVVLGAAELIWFAQQEELAERAMLDQLDQQAQLVASLIDINQLADAEHIDLPALYTAVQSNLQVVYISKDLQLRELSPRLLPPESRALVLSLAAKALRGETVSHEAYRVNGVAESLYGVTPVRDGEGRVVGAVCLLLPLEAFESTLAGAKWMSLLFAAAVAILSIPFGLLLATLFTRPLAQAQQMAARVADGDYGLRLSEDGPRELAQLSGHMNRMAEELQERDRTRQLLLASMTHELARPLGGLRLGIESLRAGAMQDEEVSDSLLNEMELSVQRMEALIEDLALSARPKTRPLPLRPALVALDPFLHGLRSRFARRAEALGVELLLDLPPTLPSLRVDEMRLFQILGNLLDNALKFTPTGGRVVIAAEARSESVRLSILDSGPGIPEHEMERMLQPFVQGDTGNEIRQGMGLGLTIASELVLVHGGRLVLENAIEGGLRASVILPLESLFPSPEA